jgi:hypothetical protein
MTISATTSIKPRRIRGLVPVAVVGVFLLLLSCAGIVFPLQAVFYLVVGWYSYVRRVMPQLGVNWPIVAAAGACLAAVGLGSHWFLSWIYGSVAHERAEPRRRWHPSWTAAITAGILLVFIAGICVVGIAHQTAWLVTSDQPIIESTFEAFYRVQSHNNLKQIGLGLVGYEKENASLPVAATFDERGRPLHSWQTRLLPFVEYKRLYDEIDLSLPWNARENRQAFSQQVSPYVHPRDWSHRDRHEYQISSYAGNAWLLGGSKRWTARKITDGTSTTILCGEAATQPHAWGDPINWRDPAEGLAETPTSFGGPFHGVTLFTFADGHATAISNRIDPAVFRALCTPAAGDKINEPPAQEVSEP